MSVFVCGYKVCLQSCVSLSLCVCVCVYISERKPKQQAQLFKCGPLIPDTHIPESLI